MVNKKILTVIALVICLFSAKAQQITFSANYLSAGSNVDAVLDATAISSFANPTRGDISVVVTEELSGLPVMNVDFADISLQHGNNPMHGFQNNAVKTFFNNGLSHTAETTGHFAPGNYSICWRFKRRGNTGEVHKCFANRINPRFRLNLIHPEDSICNLRPHFIWTGSKTVNTSDFKIVCVELGAGQSEQEAIINNPPIVNNILHAGSQLAYPAGSADLEQGKSYAWQVFEVAGGNILNSSDIAVFTIGCNPSNNNPPKTEKKESFAEVKANYTGKQYYFTEDIKFSFNNSYEAKPLNYSIIEVATNNKLANVPPIAMQKGLNRITIRKIDVPGLTKDTQYKMEIYNLSTSVQYINFTVTQ